MKVRNAVLSDLHRLVGAAVSAQEKKAQRREPHTRRGRSVGLEHNHYVRLAALQGRGIANMPKTPCEARIFRISRTTAWPAT